MTSFLPAFDELIVYIHLYVSSNLFFEYLVYQPLKCGPCILQPEGHNPVVIKSLASDEGRFLLIFFSNLYLAVPRESIHEGEEFMPCC